MSNRESAIKKMNLYGKERKSFLFIIDSEMDHNEVILLDETVGNEILFDIGNFSNCSEKTQTVREPVFEKFPVSFEKYRFMFDNVMKHIFAGNTYLINLTCETPIITDLALKEIFLLSNAKYKLLYKNQFVVFSPEIFIKIHDGIIESFPMKGTIDASVENAEKTILENYKEMAEHYTITDLIRNDLSMVASEELVTGKFKNYRKACTRLFILSR